jgi:hypothetical protein
MPDHDQRMKVALREFLPEFQALILPAWTGRFDLLAPQWQQEVFLDPPQGEHLLTEDFQMVRVLGQSTFEKGFEKGLALGIVRGQRILLRYMLEHAFGPLSKTARDQLEAMSSNGLLELGMKLREANSLSDLGFEE